MQKRSPRIGPRNDFPVGRLAGKMILGNMVVFGGVFLVGTIVRPLDGFLSGNIESFRDLSETVHFQSEIFASGILEAPEFLALLFVLGSFAGLVWYWIARHLETRNLKKRFGLLTKSCTSPTPDVKSPQS